MRPSPLSQHHPGHWIAIPYAVGVRHDKTLPRQLLCALCPPPSAAPSSQRMDDDSTKDFNTATLEAAPGRTQGMPRRSAGSQIR
jgi:hypothetical protein